MLNEKQFSVNASMKRYIINQGGTGSGKTYSTLQYLLFGALRNPGIVISVVAESLPHLKRGAIRDFKRIVAMAGLENFVTENKTDHYFTINTSLIEFFSADADAKLRGARRDVLFINECNNISYEAFQQLDVRTRLQTLLDFNPVRRFWVHDNLLPILHTNERTYSKSTYADNQYLTRQEKQNIERRRTNLNWWKVYGEGEIGMAEGVVFSNWSIKNYTLGQPALGIEVESPQERGLVTDSPTRPKEGNAQVLRTKNDEALTNSKGNNNEMGNEDSDIQHSAFNIPNSVYGIDFGFTHSPTAIVQVWEQDGELYVHELLYRTGIQNDELFAFAQKHIDLDALAVADSAEPKTIDYLYRKGWRGLKAASKGTDSVEFGINLLLDRKINVTAESVNLIKELRQYMWDTNKDGHFIRRPVKDFDHAIDALRYVYSYPKKKKLVFA